MVAETTVLDGTGQVRETVVHGDIHRGTVIMFDELEPRCECIGLGALEAVVVGLDVLIAGAKLVPTADTAGTPIGCRVTAERTAVVRDAIFDTCAGPLKI